MGRHFWLCSKISLIDVEKKSKIGNIGNYQRCILFLSLGLLGDQSNNDCKNRKKSYLKCYKIYVKILNVLIIYNTLLTFLCITHRDVVYLIVIIIKYNRIQIYSILTSEIFHFFLFMHTLGYAYVKENFNVRFFLL